MKKAFITGITGQDGSYLAELLLKKNYEVHGMIRRSSSFNTGRIDHLYNNPDILDKRLFLYYGDLTDSSNLNRLLEKIQPDEIYNLGAQSHVKVSFEVPEYTAEVDALGTLRLLDSIREMGLRTKLYQASSSEIYGKVQEIPQNEKTPFYPRSPYGVAKLYAYWIIVNYREAFNLFACNGILFNHESPRRGSTFVSRKITRAIARIKYGIQERLLLGNLDAKRDWGYAPEYVAGMWKMLQEEKPEDIVIGTTENHTVGEFVREAFSYVRLDWKKYVSIDPRYFRPTEVEELIADSSKAKRILGWEPKVKFKDLIKIMVDADMRKMGLSPPGKGDKILEKRFPDRWWKAD